MTGLAGTAKIAVIGAGAMGAGIAQVALQAGHPVVIHDVDAAAAEKGRIGIGKQLARLVEKGKLDQSACEDHMARLTTAPALEALDNVDLVIEAVMEKLSVKQDLFKRLEAIVGQKTILATNTSSISVTAIGCALARPERLVGMHFFNPAPLMKLVEVVVGRATSAEVADLIHGTAVRWGKQAVRVTSTPGFIVNRVARSYYGESLRLLEEGIASPATIDALFRDAGGFRMGPFELMDLIGHDVNAAVTQSVFEAYYGDPRFRPSLIQQELVAAGWLGRKSGRGFYDYAETAQRPEPTTLDASDPPDSVTIAGDVGYLEPLVDRLEQSGITIERTDGDGMIQLNGATLAPSDGRSATERVAAGAPEDLVLIDLALDYASSSRLAVARADQSPPSALALAAGLLKKAGITAHRIDDLPGMLVLRVVSMLVNEAAETAHCSVASPADIDRAMIFGVNYPIGPLTWGHRIGAGTVLRTLDTLQNSYRDDRYRASLFLRRRCASGQALTS